MDALLDILGRKVSTIRRIELYLLLLTLGVVTLNYGSS